MTISQEPGRLGTLSDLTGTTSSHFRKVCDMAWTYLAVAAVCEVIWASSLKASDGFTRLPFVFLMLISMLATSWLLAAATRSLPLGVAYSVWTGAGIVGSLLVGCVLYGEALGPIRLVAIVMICSGVALLKFGPA